MGSDERETEQFEGIIFGKKLLTTKEGLTPSHC